MAVAYIALHDNELAALFQFAEDAPSEIDIFEERPVDLGDASRLLVDDHVALHALVNRRLVVRRGEAWIGRKLQMHQFLAAGAMIGADVGVQESVGQASEHEFGTLVVGLVRLAPLASSLWVIRELLQLVVFFLPFFDGERMAVEE